MKLHANAALSWSGRRLLAERVLDDGWTLIAAEAAGVSVRCARKWVGRYRLEGERGLADRSSAPRRVANHTPADRVAVIVVLRPRRLRCRCQRSQGCCVGLGWAGSDGSG